MPFISSHRLRTLERDHEALAIVRADACAERVAAFAAREAARVEHEGRLSAEGLLTAVLRSVLRDQSMHTPETEARLDRILASYRQAEWTDDGEPGDAAPEGMTEGTPPITER